MKLSKDFELSDFSKSLTGQAANIDNSVPDIYIPNIQALVTNLLQPIGDAFGKPPRITSGYRCPAINKIIGGAPESQHIRGEAADIVMAGVTCRELATFIKDHLNFDQLIWEYYNQAEIKQWVHVSYSSGCNRFDIKKRRVTLDGHRVYERGL